MRDPQVIDVLLRAAKTTDSYRRGRGGQTAVAEGFAKRIADGGGSSRTEERDPAVVGYGLLQPAPACAAIRETPAQVIDEVESRTPIILFIDEAHTLVGAGGRPALAMRPTSSNLRGARALRHHRRHYLGRNTAVFRERPGTDAAVQTVNVGEPNR